MKKIIQIICTAVIAFCILTISTVAAGNYLMPDDYRTVRGAAPDAGKLFRVDTVGQTAGTAEKSGVGELQLLGVIPVKDVRVTVRAREKVVVCGSVFALRMFTRGVNVAELDTVVTAQGEERPAFDAGFMKGDVILAVNGETPDGAESVGNRVAGSGGGAVVFTVRRAGTVITLTLTPALEQSTGIYKAGLWLRDNTAGIGTLTFYDEKSGVFAGLGHCVSDAETGLPIELSRGEILHASVTGLRKGGGGQAGELTGSFYGGDILGDIRLNSDRGVYGVLTDAPEGVGEYEIALPEEIETGEAEMITSIDNDGAKSYSVEIKKIIPGSGNRNMVVHVTDTRLLAASGGIVQGMSGSPLLQNGRLIGAVTHVLLDDSATGYAIFAKTMCDAANSVSASLLDNAA
ncbi:MAG: SpoIVB peptidase [Clostridia bacterium]|nr:SpoIVB peptidase [Clostridia bacterium]